MTVTAHKLVHQWVVGLLLVCGLPSAFAVESTPVVAEASTRDGAVTAEQAKSQLIALLSHTTTLQADFKQLILANNGAHIQEASGQLYLKRPGLFRWEAREPSAQRIIVKDQSLWVYDMDLEQVLVKSVGDTMGDTPALLLSGEPGRVVSAFDVSAQHRVADKQWLFTLKPVNADALFVDLSVVFHENTLVSMRFSDHLGQKTVVDFDNIVQNGRVSNTVFNTDFPDNVDVIEDF